MPGGAKKKLGGDGGGGMNEWNGEQGRGRRTETRYNPTPSIPIAHAFVQQP